MELFEQSVAVRWADLDPNGHLRHSVYYDHAAQLRVSCLQQADLDPNGHLRHAIGPVLFREEAQSCREQGYAASGLTPRNAGERSCRCLDPSGREAVRISLDNQTHGNGN